MAERSDNNQRKPFEVVIYDDDGVVLFNGTVKARSRNQAAIQEMLKVDLNEDPARTVVNGKQVYPPSVPVNGRGFRRSDTANIWYRIPFWLERTLRKLMPDKAKSYFVSDAIEEKLARDRRALEQHDTKYQKS